MTGNIEHAYLCKKWRLVVLVFVVLALVLMMANSSTASGSVGNNEATAVQPHLPDTAGGDVMLANVNREGIDENPSTEGQQIADATIERKSPDSFFTPASFLTLAGATAIVVILVNTIRHVTHGWGPRWFALFVSIMVAVIGYLITRSMVTETENLELPQLLVIWLIVCLNGCLIYASAFGIQNSLVTGNRIGPEARGLERSSWRSRW